MPKLYFNTSRHADMLLHYGKVPLWLSQRMKLLGGSIIESIVMEYGVSAVLHKLSDPFWFQAFGCVLGMDWHSSGVTTSVMGVLKGAINPKYNELGIYICGGKGKYSTQTPAELISFANRTGLNGVELVNHSKLSAKVDNTAIQDGFQLYLHNFIVTKSGEWAVIQQGMNDQHGMARRYHWHSTDLKSFTEDPHTFIYGKNQGLILNLTHKEASVTKEGILNLIQELPSKLLPEIKKIVLPSHHDIRAADVNLKRLGSILALAHEKKFRDFGSFLLLEGVGPRTIQSLTLVSEVIYGTPSRFSDPARFSFAHGGKDGHPFPVPLKIYDETISILEQSIQKAKIGVTDKQQAIKNLAFAAQLLEKNFTSTTNFEHLLAKENTTSYLYGGRTVFGKAKLPKNNPDQLRLFE